MERTVSLRSLQQLWQRMDWVIDEVAIGEQMRSDTIEWCDLSMGARLAQYQRLGFLELFVREML